MPITLIIDFFKSPLGKYIIGGLIILSIVTYYNIKIISLESNINQLTSDINILKIDLSTSENNVKSCLKTNHTNKDTIKNILLDSEKNEKLYKDIIKRKNTEITYLKKQIIELKKPIEYPEEITLKECKMKIKKVEQNESVYINRIGF